MLDENVSEAGTGIGRTADVRERENSRKESEGRSQKC
jgi:hypothetical protein